MQVIVQEDFSKKESRLPFLHCEVEIQGSNSDIKIFKETDLDIDPKIEIKADLGYQGIEKIHKKSRIPHKKPKNGELTKKQKKVNNKLRKKRVRVEHAIRQAKVWRIVKETYRNKLRKIENIWLIVCGLVNLDYS